MEGAVRQKHSIMDVAVVSEVLDGSSDAVRAEGQMALCLPDFGGNNGLLTRRHGKRSRVVLEDGRCAMFVEKLRKKKGVGTNEAQGEDRWGRKA